MPKSRVAGAGQITFISAVRAAPSPASARLDASHWRAWLTTAVDFVSALEGAAACLRDGSCYLIETGAHPVHMLVATHTLRVLRVHVVASVASMSRDQSRRAFWNSQRAELDAALAAPVSAPVIHGLSLIHI